MKHIGDLKITANNQRQYLALTEVTGWLEIQKDATIAAPALTEVRGWIYIDEGATLNAPLLTR